MRGSSRHGKAAAAADGEWFALPSATFMSHAREEVPVRVRVGNGQAALREFLNSPAPAPGHRAAAAAARASPLPGGQQFSGVFIPEAVDVTWRWALDEGRVKERSPARPASVPRLNFALPAEREVAVVPPRGMGRQPDAA